MNVTLFDYHLPEDRIAQFPLAKREEAKLLIVERNTQSLADRHISDLPSLLHPGDLLIFNDSKVFKARLTVYTEKPTTTPAKGYELFLLHPDPSSQCWSALLRHSKKIHLNQTLFLADGSSLTVLEKKMDGVITIDTHRSPEEMFRVCDQLGEVPTPPYVKTALTNPSDYQTVYAKEVGSVAAPTAGFHFTESLLTQLKEKGIQIAFVTLHVGLGTFRPMKTDTLEEHEMHSEWISVSQATCDLIKTTKEQKKRVIAVGTTATRALETSAGKPFEGFTNLFITPGYSFQVIDGLITNFHLPKSTLLVLVSSLAGREFMLRAYQHAVDQAYRFYSFGDAMFIC